MDKNTSSTTTSRQGIELFDKKVGTVEKPDLVLVGLAMNDHNEIKVGGMEPEKFKNNLVVIVKLIKERKGADAILFSAFPPLDDWCNGTPCVPSQCQIGCSHLVLNA